MPTGAGIWWLASYPKSGNTWLRAFLSALLSGRSVDINDMPFVSMSADARMPFDETLGIDSADLSLKQATNLRPRAYEVWAMEATRPIHCKVHDAYHLTPAGEPLFPTAATRGAVYVVRDPRAVAVSFAHYVAQSIDETITWMGNPTAMLGNFPPRLSQRLPARLLRWSAHVESWLAAPFPVHLMRYEDMSADPHATFTELAAFLGLPSDRETIGNAVAATNFSRLQAQEREAGFVEKPNTARAFFREGKTDGWRRSLTPKEAEHIAASHGAVMRRLGYDETLAPLNVERENA